MRALWGVRIEGFKFTLKSHILGHMLVSFKICHFLAIPGLFEYFSEKCPLRKVYTIPEAQHLDIWI